MADNEQAQKAFDDMVFELAKADGVHALMALDGVWEIVAEHYNNDALKALEHEALADEQERLDALEQEREDTLALGSLDGPEDHGQGAFHGPGKPWAF